VSTDGAVTEGTRAASPDRDRQRLPSGRHRLTAEEVQSSQRGRLIYAFLRIIAEKGYHAATIGDVVDRAAVSRRTFYENFASKEACFVAAMDTFTELVSGTVRTAHDAVANTDWRGLVRATIRSYLALAATDPVVATALLLETVGSGPAIFERRVAISRRFAGRLRTMYEIARSQDSALPELPQELFDLLVGGMEENTRRVLQNGDYARLAQLEPLFVHATFAMFGFPPATGPAD
jgi:AcrR family transcriptional regulator